MTNNTNLPPIPAKRYFSMEEACQLADIRLDQFVEWQRQSGVLVGRGTQSFTRSDVMKLRQLQHGIADLSDDETDVSGRPAIKTDEIRAELTDILGKIEKILASK